MSEIKTNKISPRKGTTTTIGDSGDTILIPSGATLINSGSVQGVSTIDWDTTAKTTNFTAVSGKGYFINTTSGVLTVTFPASPSAGDIIGIKDYANTFSTNRLTIDNNGNNIQGENQIFLPVNNGAYLEFIYVDATKGWVTIDASKESDIEGPQFIQATGGTVSCCGDYKIHTFTSPGTFTVTSAGAPTNANVDYLVVAGGGGGGGFARGGGGGAGGYRESKTTCAPWTASPLATSTSLPVTATGYPITVGGGGSGSGGCVIGQGSSGSNSVFSTITSAGGGGGGGGAPGDSTATRDGIAGGSGGGGGSGGPYCAPGGTGNTPPVSPSQGNNGGPDGGGDNRGGSGGGGATAAGTTAPPNPAGVTPEGSVGGPGGAGATTSISASPTAYAGGGAGGLLCTAVPFGTATGGTGGGGDQGLNGTSNTGGGGGGSQGTTVSSTSVGSGGSGIVIIRYKYQ